MGKSKSSRRWLQEHHQDRFVQQARQQGYRSRAAFKLIALDEKDRIFRPGMTVVDLGAAPGGWSQVAAERVGDAGRVVAVDILPMDPIAGVRILQGDFTEEAVLERLEAELVAGEVDWVLSDMAPNMSGVRAVDQARAMYLVELALDLACRVLAPSGGLVVKAFQGEGFDAFLRQLRGSFRKVVTRKPEASRARSRELYLVAKGRRMG